MTNRIAPNVDVDNCGAPVPGRDTDSASLFCGHFAQVIGHSAVQPERLIRCHGHELVVDCNPCFIDGTGYVSESRALC